VRVATVCQRAVHDIQRGWLVQLPQSAPSYDATRAFITGCRIFPGGSITVGPILVNIPPKPISYFPTGVRAFFSQVSHLSLRRRRYDRPGPARESHARGRRADGERICIARQPKLASERVLARYNDPRLLVPLSETRARPSLLAWLSLECALGDFVARPVFSRSWRRPPPLYELSPPPSACSLASSPPPLSLARGQFFSPPLLFFVRRS